MRVTSILFNPNQATIIDFSRGTRFLGDYIGVSAGGGLVHPVWADDSNACNLIDPTLACVDEDILTATITP